MKRFIAVLSGLLVLPAFAEVAPLYMDEVIEYSDEEIVPEDVETTATDDAVENVALPIIVQPSRTNPRGTVVSTGRNAARAIPSNNATTRATVARGSVTSRTTTNATRQARTGATGAQRGTISRNATTTARAGADSQIATTRRQMQNNTPGVAARASIVQTDTVNTPLYTGRVSTRSSAVRARIPTISTLSNNTANTASQSSEDATAAMDELAQITDFCKAQYTQCMDNFCNVLDDNQGRCSCSKNIKNYAKTEAALKQATEELQDVAQQIQYIGLTGDEIETLFTQTEAELQMQKTTDNTQLKNSLDNIRDLIVDVKSGTAASTDTGLSFDLSGLLDFNISSTGFDLSAMFGNQTNTTSISNQRGEQLFKTATARCKAAVLTDCQAQGVDISIITNSYDLEIDKQCITYERELTDTNDEMVQTVRNAKSVLQRARLLVAQQKNAYDLRGCVNALDACMQDDFVCGSDYENCLDPSGKYIVNGEVVVGSTPIQTVKDGSSLQGGYTYDMNNLFATWNYTKSGETSSKNAWADNGTLNEYIEATVTNVQPKTSDSSMSKFLQYKIGYNDGIRNYGMCMSVLNKCQDITYDGTNSSDRVYNPANNVIKEYLQRTMTQIKARQDTILADYAENCISDVTACLAQNNYDEEKSGTHNIAINACKQLIKTCMSVNGDSGANPTPDAMKTWVKAIVSDDD